MTKTKICFLSLALALSSSHAAVISGTQSDWTLSGGFGGIAPGSYAVSALSFSSGDTIVGLPAPVGTFPGATGGIENSGYSSIMGNIYVDPADAGIYTFALRVDDFFTFNIDGGTAEFQMDNTGGTSGWDGGRTMVFKINMTAGLHSVTGSYTENSGGESVILAVAKGDHTTASNVLNPVIQKFGTANQAFLTSDTINGTPAISNRGIGVGDAAPGDLPTTGSWSLLNASVPEPTTTVMLALLGVMGLARRRR
jgi:PEP-CTERM motif